MRGVILLVTGGTWITGIPESTRFMGTGKVLGISVPVIVLFGLFLVMELVNAIPPGVATSRRRWQPAGRPLRGVAREPRTVYGLRAGRGVRRRRLAHLSRAGRFGADQHGVGLELQVVAAVVIGGTSIAGGRGFSRRAHGAILIGVILNGLILLGVPGIWQDAVLGALILLAVATDVLRRRILGDKV